MPKQHHDNELSQEERKQFDALSRHLMPPPHLEEKIMNDLHERGLMKSGKQGGGNWITKIAAMVALLILGGTGGYLAGKSASEDSASVHKSPLYVLLIRESPTTANSGKELVAEYGQWAAGVYKSGKYITGEKLRGTGRILSNTGTSIAVKETEFGGGEGELGGYFIIEAKDYEEAVQIASQCPHLKYGGIIELREIEPS